MVDTARETRARMAEVLPTLLVGTLGPFVAIGALILMLGAGFMAALVVLLALPFGLAVAAVGQLARVRRPALSAVEAPRVAEAPAVAPAQKEALVPVVARVLEVHGTCAAGLQYTPGQAFTFQNGHVLGSGLCEGARKGLQPFVRDVRLSREGKAVHYRCPLSGALLAFELGLGEPEGAKAG
ncbi:MAG: hypothetical protein HY686_07610 [Chloroflexi bacterium]|nr:hypothetical protein [Chloroflexota bacterium]